jgi:hypothetical protein
MQSTGSLLIEEDSPISRAIRQMTRSVCGQPADQEEKQEKKGLFSLFR